VCAGQICYVCFLYLRMRGEWCVWVWLGVYSYVCVRHVGACLSCACVFCLLASIVYCMCIVLSICRVCSIVCAACMYVVCACHAWLMCFVCDVCAVIYV